MVQRLKLTPLVFDALQLRMTSAEIRLLLLKLEVIEQDRALDEGDDEQSQTFAEDD